MNVVMIVLTERLVSIQKQLYWKISLSIYFILILYIYTPINFVLSLKIYINDSIISCLFLHHIVCIRCHKWSIDFASHHRFLLLAKI